MAENLHLSTQHGIASGDVLRWGGPLFVVGMPRSGTKLLRGLLLQHPRVRIPDGETNFLPFLVRWTREHPNDWSDSAFEALSRALENSPYFRQRNLDHRFDWRAWREWCAGRYDAAGLFEGFIRYETTAMRGDDLVWGDKSPSYVRHVPLLLQLFPEARIVHLVRDVRDYCVSIRKAWNKDVRRAAYFWGRDVANAHRACMAHPDRCIEVRYEDLLRSPRQALHRLALFLDLEFMDSMSRLDRPVEAVGDAAGQATIVRDNAQKFAERLKPHEIKAIEALAFDSMRLYHYEPTSATGQTQLSSAQLRLLQLKDGFHLLKRAARSGGLMGALRLHGSHALLTQ